MQTQIEKMKEIINQTVMQEFINTCIGIREINSSQDVMATQYYQKDLLEKERQQIIDAFTAGSKIGTKGISAEQYFLQAFKNN